MRCCGPPRPRRQPPRPRPRGPGRIAAGARAPRRSPRARAAAPARPSPAPEADPSPAAGEPPIHEAGAAGRLLAAAGELEAHVAQARAQLDALEDALARLSGTTRPRNRVPAPMAIDPTGFSISITDRDGRAVVVVRGELDLATAPELEEALIERLDAGQDVVLDLRELEFMDSTRAARARRRARARGGRRTRAFASCGRCPGARSSGS